MNSGYEIRRADPSLEDFRRADWQRLEIGSYQRDIPLWLTLASGYPGRVLELGAGAGRVTFPLLEAGHEVIAVEADPEISEDLRTAAELRGLPLTVRNTRVEALSGEECEFDLLIGPMQFLHHLSPDRCRSVLAPFVETAGTRPTMAFAVLRDSDLSEGVFEPESLPDMVDSEGWVMSSRIRRLVVTETRIVIERLRETVSPSGNKELHRACESLWRYGPGEIEGIFHDLGYQPAETCRMPEEAETITSELLVFEPEDERRSP